MTQTSHRKTVRVVLKRFWQKSLWHRVALCLAGVALLVFGSMYGIAQWYIASKKNQPFVLGASFIPAYAESLGLDAKKTMDALIDDVGIRHFRLVSYWSQLEPVRGQYDFSLLDWQFAKAEAANAKITLSLGLRQPRWPECHMPAWAKELPSGTTNGTWQDELEQFIAEVVNRYKNSPSLESYQLENEFFIKVFGECTDYSRDRLVNEYDLVKRLDPEHKIIVARSNNALGMPVGQPKPDEFGISIYKRVWDSTVTKRYLEYPFPAWYYAFVAGTQKILTGRDMIIHELQAEAWAPNYKFVADTSLAEQNKSFNAERFKGRIKLAEGTGMREVYLWGAEYWYYRKTILHDPSLWTVAKEEFSKSTTPD